MSTLLQNLKELFVPKKVTALADSELANQLNAAKRNLGITIGVFSLYWISVWIYFTLGKGDLVPSWVASYFDAIGTLGGLWAVFRRKQKLEDEIDSRSFRKEWGFEEGP